MKVKWLLVGLGIQGAKRAKLLDKKIVATIDPFNLSADFKSIDELDKDFDIAAICVPDPQKAEIALQILRMGKSCLIEKPYPVFTEAEELEVKKLISEKGVFLYTAYNHRFEPAITDLKNLLNSGKIGTPIFSSFRYGNGTLDERLKSSWKTSGANLAFDLGSHVLDLYEFLFNEFPSRLNLDQSLNHSNSGQSYLRFSCEKAIFETSYFFWKSDFHIEIYGTEGSLFLQGLQKWGPATLILHSRVFPSGVPNETRWTFEGPDPTWEKEHQNVEQMFFQIESFQGVLKDFRLNQLIIANLHENALNK